MLLRSVLRYLRQLGNGFPVVSITGPRQSGKTTLAKAAFPHLPYVNLESPAEQSDARDDPRGFLDRYAEGAILDEIQTIPELFSYLQVHVDETRKMGRFVITGSQQFGLNARISQSLAGRVGAVTLLPLAIDELVAAGQCPASSNDLIWRGFYPPLYDRDLDPGVWYDNYVQTYLERDLRQLSAIQDLAHFHRFLRLCAGRTGQLVNHSALASDAGIDARTARRWLSLLAASYVIALLLPHHRNFRKRLVKAPKLYFLDPGLAASLLGIASADQVAMHPLRGALFETMVFVELLKARLNQGRRPELTFWRDNHGREVDFLLEDAGRIHAIEVKSGKTVASQSLTAMRGFARLSAGLTSSLTIVHDGDRDAEIGGVRVIGWSRIHQTISAW